MKQWGKNFSRALGLAVLASVAGCAMPAAEIVEPAPAQPAVAEPAAPVEPQATELEVIPELVTEPAAEAAGELPDLPPAPSYKRDDVIWIQERLQELGYYDGSVDGAFGNATRSAIREYQEDQGVTPDGKPTSELREFMWRNGG